MPSSSKRTRRATRTPTPPRKGGSLQANRRIRIDGVPREQIDIHHLGRALLRIAQEEYDAKVGTPSTVTPDAGRPVGLKGLHGPPGGLLWPAGAAEARPGNSGPQAATDGAVE